MTRHFSSSLLAGTGSCQDATEPDYSENIALARVLSTSGWCHLWSQNLHPLCKGVQVDHHSLFLMVKIFLGRKALEELSRAARPYEQNLEENKLYGMFERQSKPLLLFNFPLQDGKETLKIFFNLQFSYVAEVANQKIQCEKYPILNIS